MALSLQRALADTKQELQSTRTQLDITQHLLAEKEYLVGRLHQSGMESSTHTHVWLLVHVRLQECVFARRI